MKIPLMLSAVLALMTLSLSGSEPLKIAVSPVHSFAPSNVNIRARVARDAENRNLEVVAESEAFYRSSQVPLDGEHAPATIMFQFRGLPGGEYVVSAILTDSRGRQRAIDSQPVSVISPFDE